MNTNNSEPIVLLSIDPSNERKNPLKIERKRKEGEEEANITRKREEEKKKKNRVTYVNSFSLLQNGRYRSARIGNADGKRW